MKKVIKYLGIKKYYLQNLPIRSLKSNIKKTFERIKKILKLEKIDTIFVLLTKGGIKITMYVTLFAQDLNISIK